MTIKEFEDQVRKLGFDFIEYETGVEIARADGTVMYVHVTRELEIDTQWNNYTKLPGDVKLKLFNLGVEFARTKISDRGLEGDEQCR